MPGATTPYVIKVPRHNWDGQASDARSTLQTWQWRWEAARKAGQVELDFTDVQFMEPWALAMFACFGLALRKGGIEVRVRLDAVNPANTYLEQMVLRQVVEGGGSGASVESPRADGGLAVIQTVRDAELFADRAADLIRSIDDAAADRVRYCVGEFGRNVAQHAQSSIGAVAIAQRFPELQAVQIVVCDAGRGILASLRPYYPELRTELEGLRLAVLPHTSGAATNVPYGRENMGLGLFISKEIAWRSGGSFWLISGNGLLGLMPNGELGPTRVYREIEPWDGAIVTVHLPDNAASDLQDVVAVCHELATEVQRDPTSAGLEFIDEAAELPNDVLTLQIGPIQNDLGATHEVREAQLQPALAAGALVVLDFAAVRFLTTSIAQALLSDAFRQPGSLTKLLFRNCTKATKAAVRTVAAVARASYLLRPQ